MTVHLGFLRYLHPTWVMDSFEQDGNGTVDGNGSAQDALPPPPPVIPPDVVPLRAEPELPDEPVKKKVLRIPIARRGLGSKGQKIPLVTNHFKVMVSNVEGHFFHYSVCFCISLI
jgi:eukaryotic translation initiation factor 2C